MSLDDVADAIRDLAKALDKLDTFVRDELRGLERANEGLATHLDEVRGDLSELSRRLGG